MSNVNTFNGFYNLPAITLTGTSAKLYPVPASGVYPSLPSPAQIAGNALVLPVLAGDVTGGVLDGRPFRVALSGVVNNAQSETLQFIFYNVTQAGFNAGVTATNSTGVSSLVTSTALTSGAINGKANFYTELFLVWDSVSKTLNGASGNTLLNNTVVAASHISTAVTSLNESDLNLLFSITAGSTGTGDVIGPVDFTVSRV